MLCPVCKNFTASASQTGRALMVRHLKENHRGSLMSCKKVPIGSLTHSRNNVHYVATSSSFYVPSDFDSSLIFEALETREDVFVPGGGSFDGGGASDSYDEPDRSSSYSDNSSSSSSYSDSSSSDSSSSYSDSSSSSDSGSSSSDW